MSYTEKSCSEFLELTFSKEPAPGGGGVSALVGALGAALGGMVCNLTSGKKKYACYEEDILRIREEALALKNDFEKMIDEDARNFLPLAEAYSMPSSTKEEQQIKAVRMDECLKRAAEVPIKTVKKAYEAISLFEELAAKGSSLALSDVGCGAAFLRGAISGGWLNVVINLNMLKDEVFVNSVRAELEPMVKAGIERCDKIYEEVQKAL